MLAKDIRAYRPEFGLQVLLIFDRAVPFAVDKLYRFLMEFHWLKSVDRVTFYTLKMFDE